MAVSVATATPCLGAFAVARPAAPRSSTWPRTRLGIVRSARGHLPASRPRPRRARRRRHHRAEPAPRSRARPGAPARHRPAPRAPAARARPLRAPASHRREQRRRGRRRCSPTCASCSASTTSPSSSSITRARTAPAAAQAGLGLRGSGDFHAWGDSNLYLRRVRDQLMLTIEHRAAAAPAPDQPGARERRSRRGHPPRGAHRLAGRCASTSTRRVRGRRRARDARSGDEPMSRTALRDALRVRNETLGESLVASRSAGHVTRQSDRWRLARWAFPFPPLEGPERKRAACLTTTTARRPHARCAGRYRVAKPGATASSSPQLALSAAGDGVLGWVRESEFGDTEQSRSHGSTAAARPTSARPVGPASD